MTDARYTKKDYEAGAEWLDDSHISTHGLGIVHYESLAALIARVRAEQDEEWWDLVDRASNALTDSINCSGNDARTNLAWVKKLRNEAAAIRGRG